MATPLNYVDFSPLRLDKNGLGTTVEVKREAGLTGNNVYKAEQLVTIVAANGNTRRLAETTPANVARVAWGRADYTQPEAEEAGVSTVGYNRIITPDDEFIATWQGGEADGANGDFSAADLILVQTGAKVEIDWNDTAKMMTVRDGTTNAAVQLVRVHKGGVGTPNTQVVVKFLASVLFGN